MNSTFLQQSHQTLLEKVEKVEMKRDPNENTFLTARNAVMLNYLTLVTKFLIKKSSGIYDEDLAFEITKQQQILMKSKQIQEKLKYLISKELQTAKPAELEFKPNFKKFVKVEKEQVYRPPRLVPNAMGMSGSDRRDKISGKERERASKSRLLKDLQLQYTDQPEEAETSGLGFKAEQDCDDERREFEEHNFMRLQETKKTRKEALRNQKQGSLLRFKNEFDDLQKDFKQLKTLRLDSQLSTRLSKSGKRRGEDLIDELSKKKTKNEFKSVKKVVKAFKK